MHKLFSITVLLASVIAMPAAALAEAPSVELVGAENESAVDSALQESVETPVEAEAPAKKLRAAPPSAKAAAADMPLESAKTVSSNYKIRSGDVLQITVWREENMDREVLVLPDGTISFPLIGAFNVQGMTPGQVQNTIKSKLKTLIPEASVTVLVKATLGNSVSIIGQVAKPGELVMNHSLTVMQALSQAGGLTPYADEDDIIILRRVDGKETAIEFPYDEIARGDELEKNIMLFPGDVVVVPTAGLF
ncbi:MAG: polysaccharide export protein [Proteobacteria bacterium]|nr:polysaccharide export protein [Pseudomonadota bacterium]